MGFQFEMRSVRLALIETGHCNVELKPSPIEPSWIIEGNPEARSHLLSTSACGTARTLIWSCTAGKFRWFYDLDETLIVLEGSVVIESDGLPPKRYTVGDVIVFRDGAHAKWHVEDYVKKVAFCRLSTPDWPRLRHPRRQQAQVHHYAEQVNPRQRAAAVAYRINRQWPCDAFASPHGARIQRS
jgi:uncharacterized protein